MDEEKFCVVFDFSVDGMTTVQASALNMLIVSVVEMMGLQTGGGWCVPALEETVDSVVDDDDDESFGDFIADEGSSYAIAADDGFPV